MNKLIYFLKEDKVLLGIISFWMFVYWLIFMLGYQILPENFKLKLFSFVLLTWLFKIFSKLIYIRKRIIRVIVLTFFYIFSSIYSLLVSVLFFLKSKFIISNDLNMLLIFILGCMIPYIYIIYLSVNKKHKNRIKNILSDIKVSLTFATSIITIIYSLKTLLNISEKYLNIIQVLFFFPLVFNLLYAAIVEYIATNKNKSGGQAS